MKRKILFLSGLAVLVMGTVGAWNFFHFPYNHYLRLHVLANSDRVYDQQLKLAVRDKMISVITPILAGAENAEEARVLAEAHLEELTQAAQEVVQSHGYDYSVTAEIGNFDFPDRQYDQLFLPAGNYQALRVRIGEAAGHNWWCVLYPPLCLASDGKNLTTVPQENPQTRFFLVDLWEKFHSEDSGPNTETLASGV